MANNRISASNFVALLIAILLWSPDSETANITAFMNQSPSPSNAVEGQNFTLVWTYTLDGTVGLASFKIIKDGIELLIGKKFGPGVTTVEPEYQARFKAQATDTRAELTILSVRRSDEATYRMAVDPTGAGSLGQSVVVIVKSPPKIIEISGNQTVTEGGNATVKCLADGKPTPNITWTRLSNNLTWTDIRRQDAGKYTCTANNGIGSPATGDVWIIVQYPVEATGCGKNATVLQGREKTFSCPVDGNPKPNISWYWGSEVSGRPIFFGEKFKARRSGCYICVASNSLGKVVIITQCLIVEESSTVHSPTSSPERPTQTVIGVAVGVAVFMLIMIGLLTWWVWKKKKCRKNTKTGELHYVEVEQTNNGGHQGIEA